MAVDSARHYDASGGRKAGKGREGRRRKRQTGRKRNGEGGEEGGGTERQAGKFRSGRIVKKVGRKGERGIEKKEEEEERRRDRSGKCKVEAKKREMVDGEISKYIRREGKVKKEI